MTRRIERPHWRGFGLAVLGGTVAATGQAPLGLWFATLVGLGLAFWLVTRAANAAQVGWIGWGCGLGYFAIALSWIVEPFLVDIAKHGWMAPFALVLLSGGLALLWAIAFWLSARFFRHRIAALIVLWCGFEALRTVLFTGFPWALIGHVWIDTPLRMIASVTGPHGLTLLTLMIAGLPFAMRQRYLGGVAALGLAVVGFGYGALSVGSAVVATDKVVRLVQPNAPQHEKWDPDMIPTFFWRQIEMTQSDGEVDLVVWPESALAWRLDRAEDALAHMSDAAAGTPLAFGVNDFVEGSYRNAFALIGADGQVQGPYHKHHLVPFGEYVPFGELLGALGIEKMTSQGGGGFAAGPGPELMELPGIGMALPLICYELIFPRHLRTDTRPELILQVTNDAWFGNVSGPYQHLAQARLRAVEQGLPVLRAANTGISAVIDPLGRVVRSVPLNEAGFMDERIPAPLTATVYARSGDWPMILLLAVALLAVSARGRSKTD